jgi:hypothetical protein
MARGSSKVSTRSSSSSNKVCPPNKFSFLNGCSSWSAVLAVIALCALVTVCVIVLMKKENITSNGKRIPMIENNISNKPRLDPRININTNYNNANNSNANDSNNNTNAKPLVRVKPLYEGMDTTDDGHNGTGTPTSERIQYDINLNIRDVDSYRQNPNMISYGRYEAEKNIERIVNPILPPERSYVNTYGIPINIPSRGPLQTYQQVGILYKENIENPDKLPGNNNESNILPLFGRPTYTGSNRWNYYTSSDKFQNYKLPINIDGRKCTDDTGCNELMNGDMISIPSYNGKFKVEIYDFDKPNYIPYVY